MGDNLANQGARAARQYAAIIKETESCGKNEGSVLSLEDALEEVEAILDEPRHEQLEALIDLIQQLVAQDAVK